MTGKVENIMIHHNNRHKRISGGAMISDLTDANQST